MANGSDAMDYKGDMGLQLSGSVGATDHSTERETASHSGQD